MTTLVDVNNPNFLAGLVSIAFFFGLILGLKGFTPKDTIPFLVVFPLYEIATSASFSEWCVFGVFWMMFYNGVTSACIWNNTNPANPHTSQERKP